jgi:hypothetical protein
MGRWVPLAPLTGVIFVLLAVSFALSGSTPGAGASGRHVMTFRGSAAGDVLPALSFGGAVLVAVGGSIFASVTIALSDVPGKLGPGAAQALNALSNDFFVPLIAGTCVFMIANGLATLRGRTLLAWLGWIGILIGIVAITPVGFFGFLGLMGWTLLVSVLLVVRRRRDLAGSGAPPTS